MDPRKVKVLPLVAISVAAVIGYSWLGPPADPDVELKWGQIFGAFLVFGAFSGCVLSWGRWLSLRLGFESSGALGMFAFGTAGVAMVMMGLGHLGFLGSRWMFLHWGILILGPLFLIKEANPFGANQGWVRLGHRYSHLAAAGIAAVGGIIASRMINSFLAHGTTDPVQYHLLGPRLWSDFGAIYFPPRTPIVFQCTYWEYLYLWGQSLLGGLEGKGLIEGQLFGQWVHAFFSLTGVALAVGYLSKRVFKQTLETSVCLAIIALGSMELLRTSTLAKNDLGVIFWFLAAIAFVLDAGFERTKRYGVAGAFLGISVASKSNIAFSALPLLLGLAIWDFGIRREPRAVQSWVVAILGFFICASPIWIRNWIGTGNPLYPFAAGVFGMDAFGPSWRGYVQDNPATINLSWEFVSGRAQEILRDNPIGYLLLASPLLYGVSRATRRWMPVTLWLVLSASWYLVMKQNDMFLRWVGPPLFLIPVIASIQLGDLLPYRHWKGAVLAVLAGVTLVRIGQDAHIEGVFSAQSPSYAIRIPTLHMAGDSKAWLRMNVQPGERIVSTGDNQFYYVSHLAVSAIGDDTQLDRLMEFRREPMLYLKTLRQEGVRYVLDTLHFGGGFWSSSSYFLNRMMFRFPEAVVYQGRGSKIVDLEKLDEEWNQACIK